MLSVGRILPVYNQEGENEDADALHRFHDSGGSSVTKCAANSSSILVDSSSTYLIEKEPSIQRRRHTARSAVGRRSIAKSRGNELGIIAGVEVDGEQENEFRAMTINASFGQGC
ncbi:hypothetical protein CERZMDRAFT_87928 [Cercospora zeae-maydis SCOH1-5]|uniref:Uncharacterized protein n=1 Tax=Cercospora zeae-maydis SCOH1-5 TaxID=717836 RepID=A0A6A6F324_9PEZI|nr:hypothetical protein CERZMDRAFT_87928 [Cercospora zeae-maydis SCOH1-5]